MRGDNPAKGIPKNSEERRERYLSQAEIAAVSKALADYPSQNAANAVRWLLLTGCRKSEALAMTWDQVDWDAGAWIKPSAHTKQKKTHRVPLSAPALQLLRDVAQSQRQGERFVFPGRKPGEPLKQLHTVWNHVREQAGVEDVRLHDLRHTYASILVSAGLSLPMIGALLGHTQQATTQRYAHLFDDPLREATERVGAVVSGASGQGADVVPMKRKGQGDA
jgi:integrase